MFFFFLFFIPLSISQLSVDVEYAELWILTFRDSITKDKDSPVPIWIEPESY